MQSGEGVQAAVAADDDVILLTRVVEEPPTEVVLELEGEELVFLNRTAADSQPAPAPAPAGEVEDSLADLLASLKELPADFSPPAPTPLPLSPGAPPPPEVGSMPQMPLDEAELADLVRQLAAEVVERLARELVPQVAESLVAQEIKAWKKRLQEK